MRFLSAAGAAIAAGLSAHLLSESLFHRGSASDIALLAIALCCLRANKPRALSAAGVVAIGLSAAAIAVFWPLLEPGTHHFGIATLASLLWLLPIALTFACSIALFAHESAALMREILETAVLELRAPVSTHTVRFKPRVVVRVQTRTRMFSRRGPPRVLQVQPST
jgi:hypothetical protein